MGAVCAWWRAVALDAGSSLLLDLNLNRLPFFAQVRTKRGHPELAGGCTSSTPLGMDWCLQPRLECAPLPLQRTRSLPDFYQQRASFIAWLLRRRASIRCARLVGEGGASREACMSELFQGIGMEGCRDGS